MKQFLEDFAKEKGISSFDDWYSISNNDIIEYGGGGFLKHYGHSLMRALIKVYPNYKWQDWRFSYIDGTWDKFQNRRYL